MTDKASPNLYDLLGVAPNVDDAALDHAFRVLARRLHPDMHTADADSNAFQQVLGAYAVLRDPVARSTYDRDLEGAQSSNAASVPTNTATSTATSTPIIHAEPAQRPAQTQATRAAPPLRVGPVQWQRRTRGAS